MELIHVATLIHDDVVDAHETRRGVNATAVDFGNRISVLAGDYLFAWIFKNVTATYAAPIPHILSATLAEITDGEVLQLRAMGNLDLPFDDYVEIVEQENRARCSAQFGRVRRDLRRTGAGVRCVARVRHALRDRVPDAGRSARHDIGPKQRSASPSVTTCANAR